MGLNLKKPHDSFFKKLMSNIENVKDFLKGSLPKTISKKLDYKSLQVIDTEKMNIKYKKYYLDLSVECKLSDKNTKIYIVFEHKSYADKLTLIQILNYCTVIWENCIKNNEPLIPIIPFVFYHGKQKFSLPVEFIDYFKDVDEDIKKYLVNFKIELFDTHNYNDEELVKFSNNMYLVAGLLGMKHIFEDIEKVKPVFRKIVNIDKDKKLFLTIFEYFISSRDIEREKAEKILKEVGGEQMPSLAQRLVEEGMQQGLLQEAREMVLDAYETKFDRLDVKFKKRILQITDRDKLKKIFRVILKADSKVEIEKLS